MEPGSVSTDPAVCHDPMIYLTGLQECVVKEVVWAWKGLTWTVMAGENRSVQGKVHTSKGWPVHEVYCFY